MANFTPSIYQSNIYDFVRTGKGNAVVNAVAGSGKTSTLEGICRVLSDIDDEGIFHVIFCAFNKAIAEELRRRLPQDVEVKTIHAMGMAALRKFLRNVVPNNWIDDKKYTQIVEDQLDAMHLARDTSFYEKRDSILEATHFSMLTLVDPHSMEFMDMCARYDIKYFPGLEYLVGNTLEKGKQMASRKISFSDMVWLPVVLGAPMPTYTHVLVDEAQDLSNCQRQLISKCLGPYSRLIAVGDPHQAIYGFAGASSDSFGTIKTEFNAQEFPLSVCYRCPSSHIELAQQIVPQIEAKSGANEGVIEWIDEEHVIHKVNPQSGDMVICRTNAPLVELAFAFIGAGIPASIKGRDIMGQLVTMARSVQKLAGATWDTFEDSLQEYVERQREALSKKKDTEMQIAALEDRATCLSIIYRRAVALDQRITSIGGLRSFIDRIYAEEPNGCVVLSSIHKAKGLEADNVFFVAPENVPHPMAKSDWAYQQEWNLRYVALTRAKKSLTFVPLKKKKDKDESQYRHDCLRVRSIIVSGVKS